MLGSMKKFVTTHAWARCLGLTKKFVTTVTPGGRAAQRKAQRCGGLVRIRLSYCWNIPSGTLQGAGGAPETLHLLALTHTHVPVVLTFTHSLTHSLTKLDHWDFVRAPPRYRRQRRSIARASCLTGRVILAHEAIACPGFSSYPPPSPDSSILASIHTSC